MRKKSKEKTKPVKIVLTEKQIEILDQIVSDGKRGSKRAEVVKQILVEFLIDYDKKKNVNV